MMGIAWGTVAAVPDTSGYGLVDLGDQRRRVYFAPLRWAAGGGLGVPVVGRGVAVSAGTPGLCALWPLGAGVPTGIAGGAWR